MGGSRAMGWYGSKASALTAHTHVRVTCLLRTVRLTTTSLLEKCILSSIPYVLYCGLVTCTTPTHPHIVQCNCTMRAVKCKISGPLARGIAARLPPSHTTVFCSARFATTAQCAPSASSVSRAHGPRSKSNIQSVARQHQRGDRGESMRL